MGWNLPPGCSDADIERAAGGDYDEEDFVETAAIHCSNCDRYMVLTEARAHICRDKAGSPGRLEDRIALECLGCGALLGPDVDLADHHADHYDQAREADADRSVDEDIAF